MDDLFHSLHLGNFLWRGYWGVDVFFVLSGMVLAYSYDKKFANRVGLRDYVEYLALRLGRIYPIHLCTFVAVLFMITAQYLFGRGSIQWEAYRPYDAVLNLGLLHAWGLTGQLSWNTPSWSISAEWFAYLFLLIPMLRWLKNVKPVYLLAMSAALWLAFILLYVPATAGKELGLINVNFGTIRIAVEFFAGYSLFRLSKEVTLSPVLADAFTLAGLVGIGALCYIDNATVALLPSAAVLLFGLMNKGTWSSRIFGSRSAVYLGEISYSIYMVHAIIISISDIVTSRLHLPHTQFMAVLILVGNAAVVIAVAAASYEFIEHPCREWVRRRLVASRPREAARQAAPAYAMRTGAETP